jgi:hypothetical protein
MRVSGPRRKPVRKCGKAIGPAGSRIRRCAKKAVAKVHSPKKQRWVPICAKHAREFRRMVPGELEYIKFD